LESCRSIRRRLSSGGGFSFDAYSPRFEGAMIAASGALWQVLLLRT